VTLNQQAIDQLTKVGEAIQSAIEGEEDTNVGSVLNYFLSLIPTQVALLKSSEDPEVVALALAILGK
jgi:hypothetical protein